MPMLSRLPCVLFLMQFLLLPAWAEQAYEVETVVEGLEHPWSLAWLPDGRMLVTERAGRLRLIEDDELNPEPVGGVPEAHVHSQAGLFEVVPAPDFADTGHIYLSLASGSRRANTLLVVRARLDGHSLVDVEEVFRARPARSTSVHYGGRMLFLPDGTLLITVGDGFDYREQAQDLSNHFGTIVRLNPDGSAPDNNPFTNRPDSLAEIYTYGHRNIQGIVHDAESNRLWTSDHGPRGGDELNRIQPGLNYGWPAVTHGVDYSGARITPFTELSGMESPELVWTPAVAPSGLALYRGDLFPDWEGNLLVGGLVARSVGRILLDDGSATDHEMLFGELNRRIRDVRIGPDGAIYLLTDHVDGRILRVLPSD